MRQRLCSEEPTALVGSSLSRRSMLAALGGAAGTLALPSSVQAGARSHKQPNILFIMADDLGYADLSCYGRRDFQTPVLDRLAAQGARFTQAYANSAVCSATRVALITGRYQYRLPVGLEEPLGMRDVGLPPEQATLPSLLHQAGYSTALVGKWHMGSLPKYGPLLSGYDTFWGFRGGGVDYFTHKAFGRHDLWDNDHEVHQAGYMTDLLGQRAITTIHEAHAQQRPFFMSLHFSAPHWPWEGPGDTAESQRLDTNGNRFAMFDFDGGTQATYAAMVTRMDYQIGEVLKSLDHLGIADNTIVIFTSDNGGERFSDVWPFSGRKTELLEGGLRVPAIVRWPARVKAGVVNDQVIASMDWAPTLLAAAHGKADPSTPFDGWDLAPSLIDRAGPRERTLFWRYLNMEQQACRQGDWKYLKILDNTFLFNVVDDPMEKANLKDRHPEIYDRLVTAWRDWDATMLPLDAQAATGGTSGKEIADHFGARVGHIK